MVDWVQVATSLGQIGGMGLLAGILLLLHRESLKSFVTELRAERTDNVNAQKGDRDLYRETWQQYLKMKLDQHEQVLKMLTLHHEVTMKALAEQDKALTRILDRVDRTSQ